MNRGGSGGGPVMYSRSAVPMRAMAMNAEMDFAVAEAAPPMLLRGGPAG